MSPSPYPPRRAETPPWSSHSPGDPASPLRPLRAKGPAPPPSPPARPAPAGRPGFPFGGSMSRRDLFRAPHRDGPALHRATCLPLCRFAGPWGAPHMSAGFRGPQDDKLRTVGPACRLSYFLRKVPETTQGVAGWVVLAPGAQDRRIHLSHPCTFAIRRDRRD